MGDVRGDAGVTVLKRSSPNKWSASAASDCATVPAARRGLPPFGLPHQVAAAFLTYIGLGPQCEQRVDALYLPPFGRPHQIAPPFQFGDDVLGREAAQDVLQHLPGH